MVVLRSPTARAYSFRRDSEIGEHPNKVFDPKLGVDLAERSRGRRGAAAGPAEGFFAKFVWIGGGLCASMRGRASPLRLTGDGVCASVRGEMEATDGPCCGRELLRFFFFFFFLSFLSVYVAS
jgi:hypothetical protein